MKVTGPCSGQSEVYEHSHSVHPKTKMHISFKDFSRSYRFYLDRRLEVKNSQML